MNNFYRSFSSVFVFLCISAAADEEVEFKLKFESGKTYLTESVIKQNSSLPMQGQVIESGVEMKVLSSQKASTVDENTHVIQKMDTLKMVVDAGGMKVEFDSENPEGPIAAMFAPIMQAKSTVVLDANGDFVSVSADKVPGMEALGMGEEELKQAARELYDLLPGKKIKLGGSWQSKSLLPLPGITEKPVDINYELTFEGMVEKGGRNLAKVIAKGKIASDDGNLRVTSKNVGGVIFFDPEIGQPRELTMTIDIEVGLPEGTEAIDGAAGKMPVTMNTVSILKEIK